MQSDTLDIAIAALEQKIRDVEADIGKAQFEVERAQAEGIDEDVRFWRAEKLQLRTKKKQLMDEVARKEVLQQVTALQAYSRLVVADQAALPDQNFYVDAVNMQDIGKQLLGKRTLMFLGVRQSGKSTDAMALGRKLGMFGYEVAYVCIGPKAANKGFNTEMVWAEVLQRLGIERQQGLASLSILCSLPESKKKGIVLIFDEVTALTGHAGALDIFVQEIRSLQYSTRVQGIALIGGALP
ncbi:hypothetical protein CVIRNUC_005790 [Coccomyxa viridis]|uniref:ATP-binding protein n=1 Tax=Coccomyxa viridis TaxID=1274662 RepID=A0AAV1I8F9_9CHLO|nr:hypothetical protein CVIRNUC_005790 [Coccomyxa viridis]